MTNQNHPTKLTVRNLNFYYGNQQVLSNINMDILQGQVTALIGPSGSGKTSLLRAFNLMHLLHPNTHLEGTILLDNKNILTQDLNYIRSKIGMVFQKPTPFPMSIFNNVAFGIRLHERLSNTDLASRVEWALTQAGLWDEVKDRLSESGLGLSGGQQQRLCIARALAIKPEILLLDEPTSSLDPLATLKIENLIHTLKKEYTIIIVTHNMHQAVRVSDYTGYMYLGELVEFNTTQHIFHDASQQATRDYVDGKFG